MNKITQWGSQCLLSQGYILKNKLAETVQDTPWSYVARFLTAEGYIYLKQTPPLLALEAKIIQVLQDRFQAAVPVIIAHNAKLNCFLMKEAGRSLRTILKLHFDTELLCKAIDQFTSLQLAVAGHISILFEAGVPDWRLNKIPDLFAHLLEQKTLLIEDGLSETEIRELELSIPSVALLCEKLSAYSIKPTLVQPDFNDNNTLIDEKTKKITLIDLGEIVVSHPFFSLLNCLHQVKKHYALTEDDAKYLRIREVCLRNFMAFESRENVLKAFELARPLWFIYSALAGLRLINACGKASILSYQHGKWVGSLRDFLIHGSL